VIDHLLDNAIKYSPGGQPVAVTVTSGGARSAGAAGAAGSAGNGTVRIEVADQGIGMDAEQAAHCFHKFWQAESTDVRRFGGTGIGLYIVRSLVEAMGGAVSVRSAEGAGSTFAVDLVVAHPGEQPRGEADQGESSSIREFMRQIGVPGGAGAGRIECKP
jgi:signal transduction histidine kinase